MLPLSMIPAPALSGMRSKKAIAQWCFDVGGYIELKSALYQSPAIITIAGQTAPGQGIGTRNYEISFSNSKQCTIVRYIRFRQGNTPEAGKERVPWRTITPVATA